MCACTDIFAKPSITQAHGSAHSPKGKDLRRKAFCVYYIIQICIIQVKKSNFLTQQSNTFI